MGYVIVASLACVRWLLEVLTVVVDAVTCLVGLLVVVLGVTSSIVVVVPIISCDAAYVREGEYPIFVLRVARRGAGEGTVGRGRVCRFN